MYADILTTFLESVEHHKEFMYALYRGLKPRRFIANDPEDSIICEESQLVDEMIFMLEGTVRVGFSRLTFFHENEGPFIWKVRFSGKTALLAYYVLAKTESDFIHKAVTDCSAYVLDREFIHRELFAEDRFHD